MKGKKIAALVLTCAMAATATAALAACGPTEPEFKEDTRIWYAVGQDTKGTMNPGTWDPKTILPEATFVRDESVTDANVFTLTLDIYAGSVGTGKSFKFLYKTSADEVVADDLELWNRQIGMQEIQGIEGERESTVWKLNGETVFTTADDNGAFNNIALAKGQEGKYKFTLKTFPEKGNNEKPEITVERVQKIEVSHDMYLFGDINGYGYDNGGLGYPMTEVISGDNISWTTSLEITEEDLHWTANKTYVAEPTEADEVKYAAVQVYNNILKDGKHATYTLADSKDYPVVIYDPNYAPAYPAGTGMDFNLLPVGKSTISYDQKTNAVTIVAGTHDMYFIGNFNEWKRADENYKLTEKDGVWTGHITVTEANTELQLFNALASSDSEAFIPPTGSGNLTLQPGTYAFKFTYDKETGNKVEWEKCDYYVVGTFVDADNNVVNFGSLKKDVNPVLTETETANVYTAEVVVTDVSGVDGYDWIKPHIFALKCLFGSELLGPASNSHWYGPAVGDNIMLDTAGTYVVTLTLTVDAEGNVTGGSCSAELKAA